MKERLQKIISASGYASRRAAEELIKSGCVTVNGKTAVIGDCADLDCDEICVEGKELTAKAEKTYIMLNKPRGYVTTMSDEKGRKCVSELVADVGTRVYPVGRLDMYSEGLLIMTDDGDFANRLMHPSGLENKVYLAHISGECSDKALSVLRSPLIIDGYKIKPAEVEIYKQQGSETVLKITIHEGRNRQIRKMCLEAGLKLTKLKRIKEACFELGDLPLGKWRYISDTKLQEFMSSQAK